LAEANQVCEARGQRICNKSEIQNYDFRTVGAGFTLLPDNSIGLFNKLHGDGTNVDWHDFGQFNSAAGSKSGVTCCDKDHVGTYDPVNDPMTVINNY
jgi:hypothetical protein